MSIVTITLNNKNFQLYCPQGEESALLDVAAILNQKIDQIKALSPTASTELLLVMAALESQAEVQFLSSSLEGVVNKSKLGVEEEKLAETLVTIASYLTDLAHKLGK